MDINTKTLQTNIFAKGMNTDISDAMMTNDQYRMANNLRFVTDDEENSGELHVIEGAIKACDIKGTVRGMESIRQWGVVVTEDEPGGTWHVYRFDQPSTMIEVAKISDHPLSKTNKLSLVTKYEDEKNAKVYIADGESPIRVVNIQPDKGENEVELVEDYNKVTSYPNVVLTPPTFEGLINGTLKEGIVLYSYQYYNTWGTATDASIPTRLIPLHNKVPDLSNLTNFKGIEQGKESNKGVRISIPINTSFDKVKLFRITYVEAGTPPLIEMILDEDTKILDTDKDHTKYVINDTGIEALLIYSVEEYNGISGIHIVPKIIESKDDYMFAAAIKTEQSVLDKKLSNYMFECPLVEGEDVDIYNMETPLQTVAGEYSKEGSCISWRFITQELTGDDNGNVKELIKLSKDGYANPQNVYDYTSLRRDELYRFGIILYDNEGNHSSVFWIADVRTPSMYIDGYQTFDIKDGKLKTYALGVHFDVNLNDINDVDITGYEIVRCNRTVKDIATIAQGVVSRPGRRYSLKADEYIDRFPLTPTGWLTTADVLVMPSPYFSGAKSADDEDARFVYSNTDVVYGSGDNAQRNIKNNKSVYLFACPEFCYLQESFLSLAEKDGLYLKLQHYLYGNRLDNFDYNVLFDNGLLSLYNTNAEVIGVSPYSDEATGFFRTFGISAGKLSSIHPGNQYTKLTFMWDASSDSVGTITSALFCYPSCIHSWIYYANKYWGDTRDLDSWDDIDIKDRHQYIKLYNKTDLICNANHSNSNRLLGSDASVITGNVNTSDNIPILSTAYIDALEWDDLAESLNQATSGESYPLKYVNNLKNIGDDSFVNWVSTNIYNVPVVSTDGTRWALSDTYADKVITDIGGIMGPGGKTMLIKLDNESYVGTINAYLGTTLFDANARNKETLFDSMLGTYLCNIRQNVTPYGGSSDEAKKLSNYYSYSYYNPKETSGIDVYGGDCFVLPFEYVSLHKYYHNKVRFPRNSCVVYSIPVETNINLAYTYGYEFSKNFTSGGAAPNLQDKPSDVFGFFNQDTPLYAYNGAYSSANKVKLFAAYQDDPTNIDNEDYRCYYSNPKDNNESIDNWTIYQPANFLDVDTRMGPITGLRKFHNNLVFWQKEATGLFSVNERTTITDDSNMPLLLGTGGVLGRYDYINTSNGMEENQFADTQSDSTLYWWDHNKADICAYAGGQEMAVLSKVKSVANILNKYAKQDKLQKAPALAFDKKYNEMIASVIDGDAKEHEAGSLVYSEQTQQFTGLYGINHTYKLMFADKLYLYQDNHGLYKWDESEKYEAKSITATELRPYLKYVVNDNQQLNKVFDNVLFGARIYGGGSMKNGERIKTPLEKVTFKFSTPLKLSGSINGKDFENVEYDFRFAVPRHNDAPYGDRLRGKTMQCELSSTSNSLDLSIQYITTKYRISWS